MGDRLRQLFAGASCAKEQRESIRRASLSGRATEPQLPLLGCWAKRIEYLPYKAKAFVLVGLGAACRSLPLEGLFVRTRRNHVSWNWTTFKFLASPPIRSILTQAKLQAVLVEGTTQPTPLP